MSKRFQPIFQFGRKHSPKSRRPQGVSRRARKKQLGFETLEDRRVMSAQSPLQEAYAELLANVHNNLISYSSSTAEGQAQIISNELARYQLQEAVLGTSSADIASDSIPNDPLVADQWHLINVGQQVGNPDFQDIFGVPGEDINVAGAWALGYTGAGVQVAVVDSGVELLHPDLLSNIHASLQLDALALDGDANPRVFEYDEFNPGLWEATSVNAHGTAVAGIIAAEADNGLGGTGIAYNSEIVPIRLIDPAAPISQGFEQAFIDTFRYEIDQIDITNNSWGFVTPRNLTTLSADQLLAVRDSIFFGRPDPDNPDEYLGVIHVFSSGNSGKDLDSSTYSGILTSRYTIPVTGFDHDGEYNNIDGTVTGYPEVGPNVFVAAPTGSNTLTIVDDSFPGLIGSGIYTTDTTGNTGFNITPDPITGQEYDRDFLDDSDVDSSTDYTSVFNGTSAAAPMVSGIIALMLEANPHLNWRDVQEILIRAARQNAEFATQANGIDKAFGIEFQNTWIQNQTTLFHDPDVYDPAISPFVQVLNPTLDPNLTNGFNGVHYAPTPQTYTTGAGYTVSQGVGTDGEWTGYAHGVLDAELAVRLAEQWHSKGQNLPDELTFTTAINTPGDNDIPSAEETGEDLGDIVVPGGLFGDAGFIGYWQEYFGDDPFADFDGNEVRGIPLELSVPDSNAMTVETIEVSVNISGGTAEALDHLRVVLVSPNGTHSELNHYYIDGSFTDEIAQPDLLPSSIYYGEPGSVDNGGNLVFTFSSNRNWGERYDDAIIFDPTTNEPIIDFTGLGGNQFNFVDPSAGDLFTSGWQIHFENWGTTDLNLDSIEVAWHGSPIDANTERVQGLIGVDDNRDDLFNFSRVTQTTLDVDGDPTTTRLGEVLNVIDETHESMAANVTVYAHRDENSNGILDASDTLVDQFVTGADGNYYFDLVPDDYIISLDTASLDGMSAIDDSLTPAGFLLDYQSQWAITEDYFKVWDYDSNLDVPINPVTDAPFAFLDGTSNEVVYGMQHINFLLDPGAPVAQQLEFSGAVFADFNGDGIFNGDDSAVPGVTVFADTNRNGQLDSGEVLTETDANGQYNLVVPVAANVDSSLLNIGAIAPVDWGYSDPDTGLIPFFEETGSILTDVDFNLLPPAFSSGDGSSQDGLIFGTVFNDANADTLRQSTETGLANVTVYIDANNSGTLDVGEQSAATNANGAYVLGNVAPGNYNIRIDITGNPELEQTSPVFNSPNNVTVNGAGTVTGVEFGVYNSAILDFGDLPIAYGITTIGENGARHNKGVYYLGAKIDTELDGAPSINADGDDLTLDDDEDGITFDTIINAGVQAPNATATITATASRYGGNLHAWFDFNADGDFDDPGENVLSNRALILGDNTITFDLPDEIAFSGVYARFRYGEYGLGYDGPAVIGEVEDYLVPVVPLANQAANGPDLNNDGQVNGGDFLAFLRGFGNSNASSADGDSNGDQVVDAYDLADLQASFGAGMTPPPQAATATVTESDEADQTDGADFMNLFRSFGSQSASLSDGDGDGDGDVDAADFSIMMTNFGSNEEPSVATAASATEPVSVSNVSDTPVANDAPAQVEIKSFTTAVAQPVVSTEVASITVTSQVEESPVKQTSASFDFTSRFIAQAGQRIRLDRIERLFSKADDVFDRIGERIQDEEIFDRDSIRELRESVRDDVYDYVEVKRRNFFELYEEFKSNVEEEGDALATAIADKINWRLG